MANHDAVAHAWAHQTGRQTSGHAMHYTGPTIYSYGSHFPIARHVTAPDGGPAVLFTTRGYSTSTSGHKNLTRQACSHLRVFEVDNVLAETAAQHAANHAAILADATDRAKKAARARTQASWHLDCARRLIDGANGYAAAFDVPAEVMTLESLSEWAAEADRRAAEQRQADEAARRRRELADRLSIRDRVRAWMRGEAVHVRTPTPLVRVVGDRIETTWGASASLADALAAYRAAKACRRAGRPLKGPEVDHWGRAHIDANGNITVGCHRIPFRLAQLAACRAGLEQTA